jgi:hypothetical protein
MSTNRSTRLNPAALGIALGLLWGGGIAALGIVSRIGWGEPLRKMFEELYPGYDETNAGIAVGALWGFFDALVGGVLFGWLYNAFDRNR